VVGLTSSDSTISITNNGNGSYDLKTVLGGPGSQAVLLGPAIAQTDSSTNPAISINKTAAGNLLQLASNGVNKFVVDQTGAITAGTISYAQVQGAPATTVTSIGGISGAVTLGTGLGLTGQQLNNTGVISLSGTANQTIISGSNGVLTVSLPQNIATTSSPTFAGQTLNGALTVTAGGVNVTGNSSFAGSVTQTGANTFSTGTGAVSLNGDITVASGKNFSQNWRRHFLDRHRLG